MLDQLLLLTQLKRLFPRDSPKGEPMILNKKHSCYRILRYSCTAVTKEASGSIKVKRTIPAGFRASSIFVSLFVFQPAGAFVPEERKLTASSPVLASSGNCLARTFTSSSRGDCFVCSSTAGTELAIASNQWLRASRSAVAVWGA